MSETTAFFPEFFEDENTDEAFLREDLAPDWDTALNKYRAEVLIEAEYTQAMSGPLVGFRHPTDAEREKWEGQSDGNYFLMKCPLDEAVVRYWWFLP